MKPYPVIREFNLKDLNRVLEIRRSSFVREFEIFGLREASFRRHLKLYMVIKLIQKLSGKIVEKVYVSEVEGLVVGALMWSKSGESAVISSVMVDPKHRRRGYGKILVWKAYDDCMSLGVRKIVLHVLANNVSAKNFYESLGFKTFEKCTYFYATTNQIPDFKTPPGFKLVKVGLGPRNWFSAKLFGFRTVKKYAVVKNNRLIGDGTLSLKSKKEVSKVSICVRSCMGQGVEEILLAQALRIAIEFGISRLWVSVNDKDTALRKACEKFGFKKSVTIEGMFKRLIQQR